MLKKDDKVGSKTAYKKERQRKKESEKKDRNKFAQKTASPNFGLCSCGKT